MTPLNFHWTIPLSVTFPGIRRFIESPQKSSCYQNIGIVGEHSFSLHEGLFLGEIKNIGKPKTGCSVLNQRSYCSGGGGMQPTNDQP
jgi:hypothetical protein